MSVLLHTIWRRPRSVSSHTIWGPLSDQFLYLLYTSPPRFFACSRGGHLRSVSPLTIWGPLRSVSPLTIWGPPQVSFFAYYMGSPQNSFCAHILGAPLRSVFSHTIWGPLRSVFFCILYEAPQFSFFAYYMGAPLVQFLRILQAYMYWSMRTQCHTVRVCQCNVSKIHY